MGFEQGHPCPIHEAEAIAILAVPGLGVVEMWGTWPKPRGDDNLNTHNRLHTGES
jgi:hypothetical protein